MINRLLLVLLLTSRADAQQDPAVVNFSAQTRLVLLPFHVRQGKHLVSDLKAADLVLFEDNKPRPVTIFDSPMTQGRMPLELVLLFDVNPAIPYFWDPADVFRFIPRWQEAMTKQLLQKQDAEIRICVYATTGQKLYRLTGGTTDSRVVTRDLHGLLNPSFVAKEGTDIPITLPPTRDTVRSSRLTDNYQTSNFVSKKYRGWPMEAAIGALNDVAVAQDKVSRVLVMFSEGIGATTTLPEDIGVHALDLAIPIYPVVTNYQRHITEGFPRNLWRMHQFKDLGKLTGGGSVEYAAIDAPTILKILNNFKADALAQYVVGFVPDFNSGPKRHTLEIRLVKKSNGSVRGGKRKAVY